MDKNNEIPKAPTFLKAQGKEKFEQIANVLIEDGKWKSGDEIALGSLCANYQRWVDAEKAIKKIRIYALQLILVIGNRYPKYRLRIMQ